jgi:hypothetical protein
MLRGATVFSPQAEALLGRWQVGENVSQSTQSYDPFAYSEHAMIFLSNATRLCEDDGMSDFRVYGALYLLRHGLELMLKCWSRNPQMDEILRTVMQSGLPFADVCERLWTRAEERKKKAPILLHALCALRNHLEDGLVYPALHTVNIDDEHGERSLEYVRKHPNIDRFKFAVLWPVASSGHDLRALWTEAAPVMDDFADAAERDAREAGAAAPLAKSELDAIVDLLAAMDDGGDGLRYPSSIRGAWYSPPPILSLEAVGASAEGVRATCQAFEGARQHAYSMSTFGSPGPK